MPNPFERELARFHRMDRAPRPVLDAEFVVRRQPSSRGRGDRATRLVLGVLGLFWAIVLGAAALAMLVAFGALLF